MEIKQIEYRGWRNCYHLSSGDLELIVPTSFGPRILYFGRVDHENLFAELPGDPLVEPDRWFLLGGHRFWVAPEEIERTYFPDNNPVEIEKGVDFICFSAPIENTTGIQKSIEIRFPNEGSKVRVTHHVCNRNLWPIELAPWALSVMAPGGTAIIPLPKRGSHGPQNLLPSDVLVQWTYTDMSDSRWTWGRESVMLRQDPDMSNPQKIGVSSYMGWVAYTIKGDLFLKTFSPQIGARYPDMGCTIELFTNDKMLEVETLGPLVTLMPGSSVSHVEEWHVIAGLPKIQNETELNTYIIPHVQALMI